MSSEPGAGVPGRSGGSGVPRVVVVTRPTDYERLLARHGTRSQAAFFLASRRRGASPGGDCDARAAGESRATGESIEVIEAIEVRHQAEADAVQAVKQAIPLDWRRASVSRSDLDRFLFEPSDIVVAVGQDGLVANLAKYLDGQRVLGINPDPGRYDGILVPHGPGGARALLAAAAADRVDVEARTMVEARTDDGQRLLALNEIFIGHRSHQSARYRIGFRGAWERHSSSGVIVATGTGATGWARSICHQRWRDRDAHGRAFALPTPCDASLCFLVREAFPSVATGTDIVEGALAADQTLALISEMNADGVIFGDGVEADRIAFHWGMQLAVGVASTRLHLIRGLADPAARHSRRASATQIPTASIARAPRHA